MLENDQLIAMAMIALLIIIINRLHMYPKKPTTDITGTVTEPDGTPAVAATVTLMPDNIAATTDASGNYKLISGTIDGSTGTLTATGAKGNTATAPVMLDGQAHVIALGLVCALCNWDLVYSFRRMKWQKAALCY